MWYLRWMPYALQHHGNPFVTYNLNYPDGVNLMWNTPTSFPALVASPITVAFGPIVAYNVLMTAAVALSAWCAYLALRRYARGVVAPVVGGALYGFSPYVVPHALLHLDLTLAFVPPLFLLVLDELIVRRRRSPVAMGVALAVLSACQLLMTEEVLATSVILAAILVIVLGATRPSEVRAASGRVLSGLGVATSVFVVLAAWPLVVQFAGPQRLHGRVQDPEVFTTDLLNLVVPTSSQAMAPAPAVSLSSHFSGLAHEANAYLGFALLVLIAFVAGRMWQDLRVRVAAIMAAAAAILSLGPHLHIAGQATGYPMPWLPLSKVPILDNIQPNRLTVFMYLAVAVIVTVFVDRLLVARSWWVTAPGLLVAALALVPLLPTQPFSTATTQVPRFFSNLSADGIDEGAVVLLAPFIRDGAGADPMLWLAEAGDHYRMPEGFFFIPGPSGAPQYGPISNQVSMVMEAIQDSGVVIVARGQVRDLIARDIRAKGIEDVVVGPMNHRDQMRDFFTDLFGRPPETVDGVQLWRHVDTHGVAPAPVS